MFAPPPNSVIDDSGRFRDRGTQNVGAAADIALLELREDNFEILDNYGKENSQEGDDCSRAGTVLVVCGAANMRPVLGRPTAVGL